MIEPRQMNRLISRSSKTRNTNDLKPQHQIEPVHCVGAAGFQSVRRAAAPRACADHGGHRRRLEYLACGGQQRGAGSCCGSHREDSKTASLPTRRATMPNPSLKWSANGRPPGPGHGCTHIFHGPGLVASRCRPLSSNVRRQNSALVYVEPSYAPPSSRRLASSQKPCPRCACRLQPTETKLPQR